MRKEYVWELIAPHEHIRAVNVYWYKLHKQDLIHSRSRKSHYLYGKIGFGAK
jgi:hypothetical protein